MALDYRNVKIEEIEHARQLIINVQSLIEVNLHDERIANGTDTDKYKRLHEELKAMVYVEGLVVTEVIAENLKNMIY